MTDKLKYLLLSARIVAIIAASICLLLLFFAVALMNRPWGFPSDYFLVYGMGIYIIGLLIGLKWTGLGGFIALIFPLLQVLELVLDLVKYPSMDWMLEFILLTIVLLIPIVLYLVYWRISRKAKGI